MADDNPIKPKIGDLQPIFTEEAGGSSGETERGRAGSGKRTGSAKRSSKPDTPFSLRLTWQERAKLEAMAGGEPLGSYIRSVLFEGDAKPRKTRGRHPVKDHKALGQVLGELGRSRLSANLNQLARAVNSGSLPVTPETEAALHQACEEVGAMRRDLIRALGLMAEPKR